MVILKGLSLKREGRRRGRYGRERGKEEQGERGKEEQEEGEGGGALSIRKTICGFELSDE